MSYQFTLDLNSRLGAQGVYLGFIFLSNASGAEIGYTIDDVTLSVTEPGISDPVDPGVVHDITALQAGISNDLLTVQVTERNNFQDNANTWIWVDSDQNPDTGDARYAHLGGADYMIECYTLPPVVHCRVADLPTLPTTDTETWTDFTEIPGASVSLAGNILSFQLPVSALGTPAAVDLFAGTFKGFVALDDRVADGDRCPDAGALDTATGSVVVRRPIAHPIDITFPDIIGDSTGGADLDITSARLRTFGDQLEITLSFVNPIQYTSFAYELEGTLLLDTDHSIFTGFEGMGNGIQTWGGDVLLSYSISKLSRDFTLQYFQGQSTMYTRFQPRYNDGRYRISGNQLILTASASLFDARIQTSELLQGQWHDAWIRQPVSGDMLGHLATRHGSLDADVLPENGGALDTATGQAIAPLAWHPDLTVTATDPQGDVVTSTGTDLIRIDSEVVDQNLVLKTTLSRWDTTDINHAFGAYLDTDMNADTGWVLQNNLNAPYAAVGADYTVTVLPVLTTGLVVYPTTLYRAEPEIRFHNLDALTYARPGPGNNYFTITIPLSAIGNPPELRLFVKSFMNGIPVVDVAPVYPMIIAYRNDHVSQVGLGYQPGGLVNDNPGFPYLQAQSMMESTMLNVRARTYANDITAATLFWTTNPAASSQSDWTAAPMSRELPGPGGGYDSWYASITNPDEGVVYYKFQISDGTESRWVVRAGQDGTVADVSTTWAVSSTELTYGSPPLAVDLARFTAETESDHALIAWETVTEAGNLGFNLWRGTSPETPDRQLNTALIPSQAPGSTAGSTYTWTDAGDLVAGQTYYYWLEDVDFDNVATRHGPVSVTFESSPTAVSLTGFGAGVATPAVVPLLGIMAAVLGSLAASRRRMG
ncbi:MAG TPA: hypothetical protein VL334_17055 [Anaerolineae bacterium]|nr:hypothetical protein [Anaerolineae bacterium]